MYLWSLPPSRLRASGRKMWHFSRLITRYHGYTSSLGLISPCHKGKSSGGGGGGKVILTPNFGRYVPRQSEKWARAPDQAPRSSVKMRGSGLSLSRFELENAGLRNELDPFWAWKCESPELPGRVWLALWPANPRRCWMLYRLKKFWKWWSPEWQNPPKNVEWWCSGTDFFVICENDMLRNGNSGLKMGVSRATHTNMHTYGSTPPPPREIIVRIHNYTDTFRFSRMTSYSYKFHRLRINQKGVTMFNDIPLRTRRVLSP